MEPKYVEAIKAGIIGGVIIAVLELIWQLTFIFGVIRNNTYSEDVASGLGLAAFSICCCIFLLYILTLLGTGALAVRMAKPALRDLNDALVASVVAGTVTGLIWGVVSGIFRMLLPFTGVDNSETVSRVGLSVFFGVCGLVCCLPVGVIIAVVVALIGGAIYYTIAGKQ